MPASTTKRMEARPLSARMIREAMPSVVQGPTLTTIMPKIANARATSSAWRRDAPRGFVVTIRGRWYLTHPEVC